MNKRNNTVKDISVVISGGAGQGIQSIQKILTYTLKRDGFHLFTTKEYMSRVRGGVNSTEIRITSQGRNAYVDAIDLFIPLKNEITPFLRERITDETVIIGDGSNEYLKELTSNIIDISFEKAAEEIGGKIYTNTVAVGFIGGLLSMKKETIVDYITRLFTSKGEKVVENNKQAVEDGFAKAEEARKTYDFDISIDRNEETKKNILLSGKDAVSLGALAGGCRFISSYPMSPSTGVLVSLAEYSHYTDIVVEQAESEIAAVNMAIGAWYAGARAMVTTSGGGLDLMVEGVSLAAMLESPMVFHVGQRPGPATGLPTRTAQEDLDLVLNAGHGEFARVVYAPGDTVQGYKLTQHAFNIADQFQVPVFVLTDQYFIDSYYDIDRDEFDTMREKCKIKPQIVETNSSYERYTLGNGGITYRGVPGYGEGLVKVDSDEHDEEGLITEDVVRVRPAMAEKRFTKKNELLKKEFLSPDLYGNRNYQVLVISWGSTLNIVKEAIEHLGRDDVALLHFTQVYPLGDGIEDYLKSAGTTICVENNISAQFAALLRTTLGFEVDHSILKYNGIAFSVEEVVRELERRLS